MEDALAEEHSLVKDLIFKVKSNLLIGKRFVDNSFSSITKFKDKSQLAEAPVLSFSESDLWNPSDNAKNWILTAGKVENLRIGAKKLNGIEVGAGEIFSFWKHLGNPNFGQGFVVGREIREGCIVPTIAGGLCQLSNALYDAALKANFEIVERHKHTKVIQGSLAEQNRDATVKWNYVDLRFRAPVDFRIEVDLTAEKLIVSFKGLKKPNENQSAEFRSRSSSILNDCYSCGNVACFKHPDRSSKKQEIAASTFIVDENWPEFDSYIQNIIQEKDQFIVPLGKSRLIKTQRYRWKAMESKRVQPTNLQGIQRALQLRYLPKDKNNVFELGLKLDRSIALASAKKIPLNSTHLVIAQNLLPFLYESGALGGRTYDVLMTRLPIEQLQDRLNLAFEQYPTSPTLSDFRANNELIKLENKALNQARKIITPHKEIAEIFNHKAVHLPWHLPDLKQSNHTGTKVLFPASALGRKGAYELKMLVKELGFDLTIAGTKTEYSNFWEGLKVEFFNGNWDDIGVVVYPPHVEHQPRMVLKAIAKGIPVITNTSTGLEASDLVKVFDRDDLDGLKKEVESAIYQKLRS